ncbi:MAG: LmbE family N-acetylglucosaminyl deacetylase [Candidatus Poriferisodalaceae bacterium]|jgi:LmbE family N-acetylglucosaminyl deacetylase
MRSRPSVPLGLWPDVATLVCFHAHPDDEAIATGGVMAMAADAGHRVVLVCATDGAVGEVDEGVLDPGETLAARRAVELQAACDLLGVHRLEFLGYRDSGMENTETNQDPDCFWQADLEVAARQLADLLEAERADVFTCYDDHGGYGHPDHIQVHRVGHRAAELARTPRVYEATMNRDHIEGLMEAARAAGEDMPEPPAAAQEVAFGSPDAIITTGVDVTSVIDRKRAAMAAHKSQIGEESFLLKMPLDAFSMGFGTEWFIRKDSSPDGRESTLFAGLSL